MIGRTLAFGRRSVARALALTLTSAIGLGGLAAGATGCAGPVLAKDGTVAIGQGGHGASVITANGVEYHDRKDVPQRTIQRDPSEPWHPPVGFIVPRDGRFIATSSPTFVVTPGLSIALRPSDTRVPSWGGEVLVRVDVQVPADASARPPERVALVIDGFGEDTIAIADAALAQLSAKDHVTIIDASGPRVVVPMIPGSHRSLALGALNRRLQASRPSSSLAAALKGAGDALAPAGATPIEASERKRVVVISDGAGGRAYKAEARAALSAFASRGVPVSAFGSSPKADLGGVSGIAAIGGGGYSADPAFDARVAALRAEVPPAGRIVFHDVVLTFEGTPAPSHVLEASGGDVTWRLDAGELLLGDVRAGEARTEVVRVTVPPWVAGERFAFTVTARAEDVAQAQSRVFSAKLPCSYDDDIERIAQSRNGDVIAYASALATLSRLDAAFLGGGVGREAELRAAATLQARSMARLARDHRDPSMVEQAEILEALLSSSNAP